MPKLHANLLLGSKIVLNGLKVKLNLSNWFVKTYDGDSISIALRENNMNFTNVHRVDAANLV